MKKNFTVLPAVLLFCVAPGVRADVELADGIQVVVHDAVITRLDVEQATAPFAEELMRQYRSQPDVYEAKLKSAVDESQERLVQDQLILHEFNTAGYNLPESIIDEYIQSRVKERYGDRATLTKTLAAQGKTFEKFREEIRDQFIIENMRYSNVAKEIIVSPHKIETYYLAHTNDFKLADQVKLRLILLNKPADDNGQARKIADEVLAKIREGATFAEMAKLYSQASDAAEGGERKWEELSSLNSEIAGAAAKLDPGQVSDVIETAQAIYIVKVEDKQPAHVRPLSEVRADIERILLTGQRERLNDQWINRLRKKTFVRYF